jgi:hypothetical protein
MVHRDSDDTARRPQRLDTTASPHQAILVCPSKRRWPTLGRAMAGRPRERNEMQSESCYELKVFVKLLRAQCCASRDEGAWE